MRRAKALFFLGCEFPPGHFLRPDERWWFFGMTAMSTGDLMDAGKGWRTAMKHALCDVAQSDLLAPRAPQQPW